MGRVTSADPFVNENHGAVVRRPGRQLPPGGRHAAVQWGLDGRCRRGPGRQLPPASGGSPAHAGGGVLPGRAVSAAPVGGAQVSPKLGAGAARGGGGARPAAPGDRPAALGGTPRPGVGDKARRQLGGLLARAPRIPPAAGSRPLADSAGRQGRLPARGRQALAAGGGWAQPRRARGQDTFATLAAGPRPGAGRRRPRWGRRSLAAGSGAAAGPVHRRPRLRVSGGRAPLCPVWTPCSRFRGPYLGVPDLRKILRDCFRDPRDIRTFSQLPIIRHTFR
ncbi:translation initiation factor IF-2-like [Jatropha curcas]|uniref:translation initiation factor IF-2-like n=1 Tax=Jatropha curcas TaxID=180498 RepID=UPI0018956341|nr:translation initiation factor IF-2-like [Jatropha curcas]